MRIREPSGRRIESNNIARHEVEPEEVEEVCFDDPLVLRAKSRGENPVYYVLGQTEDGRYLFCLVIEFPDGKGYPVTARPMTPKEERRFKKWKKKMKSQKIPKTDSIEELARFWDAHDITDFEDELEEVTESVFARRGNQVTIRLDERETEAVRRIASARGIEEAALIQEWVREKRTQFVAQSEQQRNAV